MAKNRSRGSGNWFFDDFLGIDPSRGGLGGSIARLADDVERHTGPGSQDLWAGEDQTTTEKRLAYYDAPEHLRIPDSLDLMTQDEWNLANLTWTDDAGVVHAGVQPSLSDFANYNYESGIGFGQGVDPDTGKSIDPLFGKVGKANAAPTVAEGVYDTYDPTTNTMGMSDEYTSMLTSLGVDPDSERFDTIGGFHTTRPDSPLAGVFGNRDPDRTDEDVLNSFREHFGDSYLGHDVVIPDRSGTVAGDGRSLVQVDPVTGEVVANAGTPNAETPNTGVVGMQEEERYNSLPLSVASQNLLGDYGFDDSGYKDNPFMTWVGNQKADAVKGLAEPTDFMSLDPSMTPLQAQFLLEQEEGSNQSRVGSALAFEEAMGLQRGTLSNALGTLDAQESLALRNYGREQNYASEQAQLRMQPGTSGYENFMARSGTSAAIGRADIQNQYAMSRVAAASNAADRITSLITGADYSSSIGATQGFNMGMSSGMSGVGGDPARLGSSEPSPWSYAATGAGAGYMVGGPVGAVVGGFGGWLGAELGLFGDEEDD